MKALKLLLFLGLMAFTSEVTAPSVYVTKRGEKYHYSTCHFLKNSKKEITLSIAKEGGFTASSDCKPKAVTKTLKPVENS